MSDAGLAQLTDSAISFLQDALDITRYIQYHRIVNENVSEKCI